MNENRQSKRVQVSVSATVRLALAIRAARLGVAPSTMAAILLRQSLDQTIQSEAFREQLRAHKANWTTAQRLDDMQDDREMEMLYEASTKEEQESPAGAATATT